MNIHLQKILSRMIFAVIILLELIAFFIIEPQDIPTWAMIIIPMIMVFSHWVASIVAQSIMCHRFAAHQSIKFVKPIYLKVAYVLSYLALGASTLKTYVYAIMHRIHHKFSDTPLDVHQAIPGFFGFFKTLKQQTRSYLDLKLLLERNRACKEPTFQKNGSKVKIDTSYQTFQQEPWYAFDDFVDGWDSRIAWVLLYSLFYYVLGYGFWMIPLVLIHSTMAPVHGMIVNWVCHIYGNRNYDTNDKSVNMYSWLRPIARLYGELYHNNHHSDPTNPNFAHKDGEYDWIYSFVLKNLERMKIIEFNVVK